METESMETKVKMVRAMIGSGISETDILRALSQSGNNTRAAIDLILYSPSSFSLTPPLTAQKTLTSAGGIRISTLQINLSKDVEGVEESEKKPCDELNMVKQEPLSVENREPAGFLEGERGNGVLNKCKMNVGLKESVRVKEECDVDFVKSEVNGEEKKVLSGEKSLGSVGRSRLSFEEWLSLHHPEKKKEEKEEVTGGMKAETRVKEEPNVDTKNKTLILVNEEVKELITVQPLSARKLSYNEYRTMQFRCTNGQPKRARVEEMSLSSVVIEDGDFLEEPDWLLVGRTVITGLSTTKGRKLENNEIVHFAFPSADVRTKSSSHFMGAKAANAASTIVRFSTKRYGEVLSEHYI